MSALYNRIECTWGLLPSICFPFHCCVMDYDFSSHLHLEYFSVPATLNTCAEVGFVFMSCHITACTKSNFGTWHVNLNTKAKTVDYRAYKFDSLKFSSYSCFSCASEKIHFHYLFLYTASFPPESVVQLNIWNCRKTLQINVTTFSAGVFVERSFFSISDSLWDIPVPYSSWMVSSQLGCSFLLHIPLFFVLGNSSCSCSLHRVLLWGNSSCILKWIWNSKQAKKCLSSLRY